MNTIKLFIIIFFTTISVFAQSGKSKLIIEQQSDLYHKPVSIFANGLPKNQKVTFTLKATDAKNHSWNSKAIYISDSSGSIDLSKQPSIGGNYLGIEPMGLFWSMKSNDYHQIATNSGFKTTISISINDEVLDEKAIYRKSTRELDNLKISYIQKRDSIIANLYIPKSTNKIPAIIFLGGSGGGFRSERASLYASEGFAVLDLKYFRYNTLPDGIIEIPLEYVEKAHKWLSQQPEIDKGKIGIIGRSRGSELAMLYASKFDNLKFVIAQAPSNVVWFGWEDNKSSWTFQNKPFPYAEYTDEDSERIQLELKEKGLQYRDGPKFLSAFENKDLINKALIPVEDIKCPILFISGKDDQVWPSSMMADMMVERLQEKRFGYEFMHLTYENAGHNFAGGGQGCGIPYLPPEDYSKGGAAKGGTDKGNVIAAIESWNDILKYIKRHLED